jgi:hypothetical protein
MINIRIHKKLLVGQELDESRKDDALKAHPDKHGVIDYFLKIPIENNKYLLWMAKHATEENKEEVYLAVYTYDEIVKSGKSSDPKLKDINQFKSLEELIDFITDHEKSIKDLEREGAKIIYPNDGRFEIIRPYNVQSSCHRGRNSRWCIAATKTKNYYKIYTKSGAIFYTVIDHSKPIKDPDSMFTYVLYHDMPRSHRGSSYREIAAQAGLRGAIQIFDAEDKPHNRGEISVKLGTDTEAKFFNLMKDHSGLGELSHQLENYNHFYARIMKMIDPDKPGQLALTAVKTEIEDFIEEWHDEYVGVTHIIGDKKRALRNIYSFLNKLIEIDDVLLKKKIGISLADRYLKDPEKFQMPDLQSYIDRLKYDPNWKRKLKELSELVLDEGFYIKNTIDTTEQKIKEFCEMCIDNNVDDQLEKMFKFSLKIQRGGYKNLSTNYGYHKATISTTFLIHLASYEYKHLNSLLKAYFDEIVDGDEYEVINKLEIATGLLAAHQNLEKKNEIKNELYEHALNLLETSGNKVELSRLCNYLLRLNNLSGAIFDRATKGAEILGLEDATKNVSALKASSETLSRLVEHVIELEKDFSLSTYDFANYIRFILQAPNLSKEDAKKIIMLIADENADKNIVEIEASLGKPAMKAIKINLKNNLGISNIYEYIKEIRANLKKSDLPLDESRLFGFNKDYKVFKIKFK